MMTAFILEPAALLLGLLCLRLSLRDHRTVFSPLPATLRDRHAVYPLLSGSLVLSALAAVAGRLGESLGAADNTLRVLETLFGSFQLVLFAALALYVLLVLCRRCAPVSARKSDRLTALLLVLAVAAGAVIQALWAVRVALFFEAIALFGALILLEQPDDPAGRGMNGRLYSGVTFVIVVTLLVVIAANALQIRSLSNAQSEEIGTTKLDVIRDDLQETITDAKTKVLRLALSAGQLLEENVSRETLAQFFDEQYDRHTADGTVLNVYIAGPDWHIVPHFNGPADFHAAERIWYIGAQDCPGEVYVSDPYLDANGQGMCFTVSTLLSDGETVVGMDLNFSKVQESILRMTQGRDQTAMIVTSGGLIAGYTDMSLVGERADEKLSEYAGILRRVASSQEHGSFRVELDGHPCIIFSSETSNHWLLILSVDTSTLYAESHRQMAMTASVNLLMLAVVVTFALLSARKARRTEAILAESTRSADDYLRRLREAAAHLLRLGDTRLLREGADPAELAGQVRTAGEGLSALGGELDAYVGLLRRRAERQEPRGQRRADSAGGPSRRVRNGIIIAMLVSLAIVLGFCGTIASNWGANRMNREADGYEDQLSEWLTRQKSVLYMFTDIIASQPQLLDDYDGAVRWLSDVAGHYPEMSACYMTNPYAEHPVIMNTGWEPEEGDRPETRPWYRETKRSSEGFNVSEPYLDTATGNYCITLSRVVNGKNGEFLGIFGIDFFLDKLILVLGESYTSRSYAFLVDSEGDIINHPNEAYQMGKTSRTSVEDTEYAEARHSEGVTVLRDYAGHIMACLGRTSASGFTVLVANRWWDVYGSMVIVGLIFLVLFGACLTYIVSMINSLIRWQSDVNHRLVDAAEAAQSANRAKSQFLSQMSHEIRTPMNSIIGLDNIALRDESISPQTRGALEKIGASARHLLALINDILDMSRIESGRMTLKADRFSFRDFLEQITIIVSGQCEDKGLRFVCRHPGPVDAFFVGDDLKLKQVLINILGNSVKFTDPPGVITFTVEQAEADDESALLRFTMEDTGIGMDKEFIPRLFEAFSQENAGTTDRYGGSGLGMAITRSIVEMMGGEIRVESEKGLGSTFTVTVRLGWVKDAVPEDITEEPAPQEAVSLAGRHMLIAEDQEMNAEVLTDLLELEDISSEWAQNGQLAVELFAGSEPGHFDAILMDMRMPVMDGLSATREIRKLSRPDAAAIPIIALTANAFEEDEKQCLEAGMDAHLSKPVDIEKLKQTAGRLLAARQREEA